MKILNRKQKKIQVSNTDLRDGDLERLLLRQRNSNQKDLLPSSIRITQGAKEKAFSIGPAVKRIGNSAYEWYGFLLGNIEDSQHIIREIILAQDQDVSGGHVQVEGVNVARANQEVKEINKARGKNYQIIGWTHSHADFGTNPSNTDDNNNYTVLNSVSLNTEVATPRSLELIEGKLSHQVLEDRLLVRGEDITDGHIEYLLKDDDAAIGLLNKYGISFDGKNPKQVALELLNELLTVSKFDIKEPKIAGFCYSIVVNNKRSDPYSEMAIIEESRISRNKRKYSAKLPLVTVSVDDDISFTIEELDAEINKKIKFPKSFLHQLTNYKKGYTQQVVDTKRGGVVDISVTSNEQPKKDIVDKETIQKDINRLFAEKAIGYIYHYQYMNCKYSRFMEDVLRRVIIDRKNLVDAIRDVGYPEKDTNIVPPRIWGSVFDSIASVIDKDIKTDKEKQEVFNFMFEFFTGDLEERSMLIEKYVPRFLGIDDNVIKFARESLRYAESSKPNDKYSTWMSMVLKEFVKHDGITLEESVSIVGKTEDNHDIWDNKGRKIFNTILTYDESKKIQKKLIDGKYDEAALEFVTFFNDPSTRNEAVEIYSASIAQRAAKDEEVDIKRLIGARDGSKDQRKE